MTEEGLASSDEEELLLEDEEYYSYLRDFKEFTLPEKREELSELLNDDNISIEFIIPNGDNLLVFYQYPRVLDDDELKEHLEAKRLRENENEQRKAEKERDEYDKKMARFKKAAQQTTALLNDKGFCALKTQREKTTWMQVKYGIIEKSLINDIMQLSLPEMREILKILNSKEEK